MDTEAGIEDEALDSVDAVEIVADTILVHQWGKTTTDRTVMDKEVIDRALQWEIHHRVVEEADTIRI